MLIVSALSIEIRPLMSALAAEQVQQYSKKTGLYRSKDHDLLICGLGPMMAERSMLTYLKDHHPEHILNIGSAGILDPALSLRKLYNISSCYRAAGDEKVMLTTLGDSPTAYCISLDRALKKEQEKQDMHQKTGAQLVDMECYSIARIAEQAGIKMSAIKVTTDLADESSTETFYEHIRPAVELLRNNIIQLLKKM